jgi:hypothetical protein
VVACLSRKLKNLGTPSRNDAGVTGDLREVMAKLGISIRFDDTYFWQRMVDIICVSSDNIIAWRETHHD